MCRDGGWGGWPGEGMSCQDEGRYGLVGRNVFTKRCIYVPCKECPPDHIGALEKRWGGLEKFAEILEKKYNHQLAVVQLPVLEHPHVAKNWVQVARVRGPAVMMKLSRAFVGELRSFVP